ncbi:hypothetical protein D3C71_2159670 [compost metagenome]
MHHRQAARTGAVYQRQQLVAKRGQAGGIPVRALQEGILDIDHEQGGTGHGAFLGEWQGVRAANKASQRT